MAERPYTLLSCCISMDGYLDAGTRRRLLLSNDADFRRVDEVRAGCDAIMAGAGTIRSDDPRLIVHSDEHRERRERRGQPPSPTKVTVTASGNLDRTARFFTTESSEKIVYATTSSAAKLRLELAGDATIVHAGESATMRWLMEDLHARGIRRVMVEGGSTILTQFLAADLVDELHLAIAPLFVGSSSAPRFVGEGDFPWDSHHRARLASTRQLGDVVLLTYALSPRFEQI